MAKTFSKTLRLYDSLNNLLGALIGAIIMLMMLAVGINTLSRYILNNSMNGVIEACEWGIMSIPFLGAAWLLRTDGHIRMDVVFNLFAPKARIILNTFCSIIGAIVCLVFAYYVAQNAWQDFVTGYYRMTALSLPRAPFTSIMTFGFILLVIQFVRRSCWYATEWTALSKGDQTLGQRGAATAAGR